MPVGPVAHPLKQKAEAIIAMAKLLANQCTDFESACMTLDPRMELEGKMLSMVCSAHLQGKLAAYLDEAADHAIAVGVARSKLNESDIIALGHSVERVVEPTKGGFMEGIRRRLGP